MLSIKKNILLVFVLCVLCIKVFATHNRAGEITFVHIVGYTYEITITTITYSPSTADRNELEVSWGDGSFSIVERVNGPSGYNTAGTYCNHLGENLTGYKDVQLNKYTTTHTFSGNGNFCISVEDPNRNYGIINIPNSVNVPFYIETLLVINPFMGANNSPQLLLLPVDKACVNTTFITNPGAYDPDGDSLSYELINCMGTNGQAIPGYSIPEATKYFAINEYNGNITWEKPLMQGEYNVAVKIKEWRNGALIGYIVRDFQILVVACNNQPPVLELIADTCVTAGNSLNIEITAIDYDYNFIKIEAEGEPFFVDNSNAKLTIVDTLPGSSKSIFSWTPSCFEVRKNPYTLYCKATDLNNIVNLSAIGSISISVLGPTPLNLSASTNVGNVYLSWDSYNCSNANGYYVYRSHYPDNYQQGTCSIGMPADWNYEKIATINNINTTNYTDYGYNVLNVGINYSYRISAFFKNNVESKISEKTSVILKKDIPVITHVTVETTSAVNGKIAIILSPPNEIDSTEYPGPYRYVLFKYDEQSNSYVEISYTDDLNDSIFYNENLNTLTHQHKYYFGLFQNDNNNLTFMGKSSSATSLFLISQPTDKSVILNWTCDDPWNIEYFKIYRKNDLGYFDSIAISYNYSYTDKNLINEHEYCYYVESVGYYSTAGYIMPILNKSQIVCETPYDNQPPCTPELYSKALCEEMKIQLYWNTCDDDDILFYYIYYQQFNGEHFVLIDSLYYNDTVFTHDNLGIINGCYYIIVKDYSGNLSEKSNIVCFYGDECIIYELPNAFTPNGDGFNDKFVPIYYSNIKSVDATIFNRQGRIVYSTTDIEINWDGKDRNSHSDVSTGVYFYVVKVEIYTYDGSREKILSGYITLIR